MSDALCKKASGVSSWGWGKEDRGTGGVSTPKDRNSHPPEQTLTIQGTGKQKLQEIMAPETRGGGDIGLHTCKAHAHTHTHIEASISHM